ncbi:hypothetical protein [Bacillus sp. UMB0728]|uniref:hypothetical protein n=1 Tax=Bacillus sp. UMB0728 TaxID=2066052 RepID=UPI000C76DFD8|nr:hypothetical protein [Bacillus sp. UMB0728]PLR71066.1 hypothetical protein CYJ37_19980 [Bacillus sp. UMB0728]
MQGKYVTNRSISLPRLAKYYSSGMLITFIGFLLNESGVVAHLTFSLNTFIILFLLLPCFYTYIMVFSDFNEAASRVKLILGVVTMIGVVMGLFVCGFLFGVEAEWFR